MIILIFSQVLSQYISLTNSCLTPDRPPTNPCLTDSCLTDSCLTDSCLTTPA